MDTEYPGRPRVAVIEDDAAIARLVREILDAEGFDTLTVDRRTPIDTVRSHRPQLLLLDLLLGDAHGRDILAALRRDGLASVPVVLFSASPDLESHMDAVGAVAFVTKPFDIDDLIATCRSVTATYA